MGTTQSNRKVILVESKDMKDRETNSYEIYWEKDNGILNLNSFVVKIKSLGTQNLLIMLTMLSLLKLLKMTAKTSPICTTTRLFKRRNKYC